MYCRENVLCLDWACPKYGSIFSNEISTIRNKPVNAADNVVHLVVGLGAAAIGFFVNDSVTRGATASGRREDPMVRP